MRPFQTTAMAALPVLLVLLLMLVARWSAARAGAVGFIAALAVALGVFGYGDAVYPEIGRSRAVAGALAEAGLSTFSILWILFPALGIYHLQARTGAIGVLERSLRQVTRDRRLLALFVGWFFVLFLEGAAGFGTPVAIAAPLLVSVGFRPVDAVALALIGNAAGVAFGAIGTPILPQLAATGLEPLELARANATLSALLGGLLPFVIVAIASGGQEHDRQLGRSIWLWTLLAGLLFLIPFAAIAWWVGPELPTLGGALAGGVLFVLLWLVVRRSRRRDAGSSATVDPVTPSELIRAAAPYLLLIALVLMTRLIGPVRDTLAMRTWEWDLYGRFSGSLALLYHPGTLLLGSLLLGAAVQRVRRQDVAAAFRETSRRLVPVAIALIALVGLSRLMVHAGMIDRVADAAVLLAGRSWPMLTPFVGVLGTFVTGSATASNILFTDLQAAAARQAGMAPITAVGAQGFGAAAGNMIAPLNLLAGAATVGLVGREDEILRRALATCLLYTLLGGILVWAFSG